MLMLLFAILCGLLGEALEVSRLRYAGISLPGLDLRLTLFAAYLALGGAFALAGSFFGAKRTKVAAALFAIALAVPWANFEILPAAGSSSSIAGSLIVAVAAAAVGWLAVRVPRVSTAAILTVALAANLPVQVTLPADVVAGNPGTARGKPNLLLILVDTLRADHLGAYGYDRPTSPRIDAMAEQGIRFDRTIAQAAWTKPAVASLFTGRYVHRHGVIRSLDALGTGMPTLASLLQGAGYRTAAFSANPWITPEFRFSRGFGEFESGRAMGPQLTNLYRTVRRVESLLKKAGAALPISGWVFRWAGRKNSGNAERDEAQIDSVVDWLRKADGPSPFFLYVHMIGPHDPYDPPDVFAKAFARSSAKAPRIPPPRVQTGFETAEAMEKETLDRLVDQYDAAIAHSDSLVGRILDELAASGLADDTVVILTADHGEEFYEHGNWRHGNQLYDEVVRVPLLVRIPGGGRGVVRKDPAMTVDILPTALAILGVEGGDTTAGIDGRALIPQPETTDQATFSEHWWFDGGTYVAQAVERGDLKLQTWRDEGKGRQAELLYDLRADRGEQANLLDGAEYDSGQLAELRTTLDDLGGTGVSDSQEALDDIDPVTRERLRKLGYLDDEQRK